MHQEIGNPKKRMYVNRVEQNLRRCYKGNADLPAKSLLACCIPELKTDDSTAVIVDTLCQKGSAHSRSCALPAGVNVPLT